MAGSPLRRMVREIEELGVSVADLQVGAISKPQSIADRTGLNGDIRNLSETLVDKRAKPSAYSTETAEAILTQMVEGRMLTEICMELDDAPHPSTVYHWISEHVSFARAFAEARRIQATTLAELGYIKARDAWHPAEVQASANYLRAVQWLAAKLDPKGYGDKAAAPGASLNVADMAESDLEGLMATLQQEKAARAAARQALPAASADTFESDDTDDK